MGGLAADADWVKEVGELVAPSDLRATQLAEALMVQARQHVQRCGGATCLLRDVPGGPEACVLALELSLLGPHERIVFPGELRAAAEVYLASIRGAAVAVHHCRRVEHRSGRCLFDDGSGRDLCARVLGVSHLISPPDLS